MIRKSPDPLTPRTASSITDGNTFIPRITTMSSCGHDAAGHPAVLVAARAALLAVGHHVSGPVAQHREARAPQRREHQLAALARRGRVQVVVEDLADELVVVDVQAAALRQG